MAKNVLGNDPFAADDKEQTAERPPDKGGPGPRATKAKAKAKARARAKARAKPKATPKKKPAASAASRQRLAQNQKKARPAGEQTRTYGGGPTALRGSGDPPSPGGTSSIPPQRQAAAATGNSAPRPPLPDGAAARLAAQAVSQRVQLPGATGEGAAGTAGDFAREARTGSLSEEIRRIEQRLTRRPMDGLRHKTLAELSLIDRVGQLLHGDALRRLMMDWRLRYRSPEVDEFGLDPLYAERCRPLLDFLYHSYWRVDASGVENLPDEGRAIIVANHAGTLPYDGLMVMSAVRHDHPAHREVRPLVEDFIFHFPYLGSALNRIGCVRACPENAERLLLQDRLVAVFPEGIKGSSKLFRSRYRLQRFGRGGFIKLALHTRAPIIPAAVIGSEEVHPLLGKVSWLAKYLGFPYVPITPTFPWLGPLGAVPLPSKWQIRFGEPLDLASEFGAEAADNRILVHQLADKVRSTIQSMVDEALLARQSIIFG